MKKTFTLILYLACQSLTGQWCEDLKTTLSNDVVVALAKNRGSISDFEDRKFRPQADQEIVSQNRYASLFIEATRSDGVELKAYNLYSTGNVYDFYSGILVREGGETVPLSCGAFNRLWSIHKYEMERVIDLYNNGQLSVDDVPTDILT